METYTVNIKKSAAKQIGKFPVRIQRQTEKLIDSLAENPTPAGSKKIDDGIWQVRFADNYRMQTTNRPYRLGFCL
jgi:mRNA-degrading endonuclease RelE of RelBE toxin-antitoxin system